MSAVSVRFPLEEEEEAIGLRLQGKWQENNSWEAQLEGGKSFDENNLESRFLF